MIAFAIVTLVVTIVAYLSFAIWFALKVAEWTEGTGFSFGLYMITVAFFMSLPPAIIVQLQSNS